MAAPLADAPWVSVIIPALNEAAVIDRLLAPLQPWRQRGVEVILVDGGSHDGTADLASSSVNRMLLSEPGRARQMNAGARSARAPLLWFLHADTELDDRHLRALQRYRHADWGRFDVRLRGRRWLFRLIGLLISLRSRITGIATGDQGLFVSRACFDAVGGFPEQPLMEDVELSARLKARAGRPCCLRPPLTTDSRRWERAGPWRTVWLMWRLRWDYWRGVDPVRLHARYYRSEGDG